MFSEEYNQSTQRQSMNTGPHTHTTSARHTFKLNIQIPCRVGNLEILFLAHVHMSYNGTAVRDKVVRFFNELMCAKRSVLCVYCYNIYLKLEREYVNIFHLI